jgi:predicted phage terminase large subunit-like protein
MNEHRVLAAVLRSDLSSFVWKCFVTVWPGTIYLHNWHIEAIVHRLMGVQRGEVLRLLITQPPRSTKSISVSIAFAAWLLGHDPRLRIMVVSYGTELALDLHRQFRMVVDAPWYRQLFPKMHSSRDTGLEFVTTLGGGRYASSVGGTLTGRGADLIIVDDPLKAEEANSDAARQRVNDWYGETLVSRLNDKKHGPIIVVAQRLHEDDLPGHLIEQGGWTHLDLPAIAVEDALIPLGAGKVMHRRVGELLHPEREDHETLMRLRAESGSPMFSAQYQQRPVPLEGNIVRRKWFQVYDHLPESQVRSLVQSWDVAMTTGNANDFSCCTTWLMTKDDYYLLDVFRDRLEYPDLRRAVARLAMKFNAATILIEDAGPGMLLLQDLRREPPLGLPRPIGQKPEGSKADRMVAQSAKIEAGQVFLPRESPWLDTFLREILAFPNGRYDDQVDSLVQFLNWAARKKYRDDAMPLGLGAKVFQNGVQIAGIGMEGDAG